ncbi:hypothetical protein CF65_00595 [Aggregatibacter actinomycetemcomitans HK1651]|nr:hypothetical protein CF65_00595 [Aggregatibacter actinomycetemcomitans HK1651]
MEFRLVKNAIKTYRTLCDDRFRRVKCGRFLRHFPMFASQVRQDPLK